MALSDGIQVVRIMDWGMKYCRLELFCAEKYLRKCQETLMKKCLWKFLPTIINHFITTEIFCNLMFLRFQTFAYLRRKFQFTVLKSAFFEDNDSRTWELEELRTWGAEDSRTRGAEDSRTHLRTSSQYPPSGDSWLHLYLWNFLVPCLHIGIFLHILLLVCQF